MRLARSILIVASLSACAGPTTVLQRPETMQVVTCEASTASALLGGPIGAIMSHDSCVQQYKALGFVGAERDQNQYIPLIALPNPPA